MLCNVQLHRVIGVMLGAGSNGERRSTGATSFGGDPNMIGWSVTFLVIALLAAVLGFMGITGVAVKLAWSLFVVGLALAVIFAIGGRRRSS